MAVQKKVKESEEEATTKKRVPISRSPAGVASLICGTNVDLLPTEGRKNFYFGLFFSSFLLLILAYCPVGVVNQSTCSEADE